ncbi:MAG TPA: SDR family oxidoreductase [Anaerolineales bacterium]|nr:SDR family oxidoreductase [Anaerolineales bacterium]
MKANAFRDQVVIVTGASAGIGQSVALLLASQCAKVVIAARRIDPLEQIAEQCRMFCGEVLVVPTDVSNEMQCKALIEKTINAYGKLDMLINNAGMAASALLDEFHDLCLFKHTMDINFYGAVYCTYYTLPYLKQTHGRIVAISSLAGKTAIPYNTPYCASKYALHGFYDSLRMELYQSGVSCTLVCPSWVATEFHESQLNKNGTPRGERGRVYYTKKTMTSDQCAQIILNAAHKRHREVLMGPGALAVWFKVIAPGLLDWFAVKIFLGAAIRRARAGKIEVNG